VYDTKQIKKTELQKDRSPDDPDKSDNSDLNEEDLDEDLDYLTKNKMTKKQKELINTK
jgi:hypothetical protein